MDTAVVHVGVNAKDGNRKIESSIHHEHTHTLRTSNYRMFSLSFARTPICQIRMAREIYYGKCIRPAEIVSAKRTTAADNFPSRAQ